MATSTEDARGSDKKGKKDFHVLVVTTADDLEDDFDKHETLQVVFDRAVALVGGQGQPDQFSLEYKDQPVTELTRTLKDASKDLGFGQDVEFELVPKPVVV